MDSKNNIISNVDAFKQIIKIDDSISEDNVQTIMSLGIIQFDKLSLEQNEVWGYVISLVDINKNQYIVTLDENGCLGTVRRDSLQGEIIYLVRDD